jgi:hypothetical protein
MLRLDVTFVHAKRDITTPHRFSDLQSKLAHRMTADLHIGATQHGGNHRATASPLTSGTVLNAMTAAEAALCTVWTTASNSTNPIDPLSAGISAPFT